MAVALVGDPNLGTSYGIATHVARGEKMFVGYINCSGNSYVAGGFTCTLPINKLWFVNIERRMITGTNVFFGYDRTNTKVLAYEVLTTTTAAASTMAEIAAATDLSSFTAVYCFAIGRD
jgi:hypothetical protein